MKEFQKEFFGKPKPNNWLLGSSSQLLTFACFVNFYEIKMSSIFFKRKVTFVIGISRLNFNKVEERNGPNVCR